MIDDNGLINQADNTNVLKKLIRVNESLPFLRDPIFRLADKRNAIAPSQ